MKNYKEEDIETKLGNTFINYLLVPGKIIEKQIADHSKLFFKRGK